MTSDDTSINDIFQSKYLSAKDLQGRSHTVVIATAEPIVIGQGANATTKIQIAFQGRKKPFLANKTNAKRIAFMYGDKLRGWIGKEIELYVDIVDFQGEATEAIRVRRPPDREPAQQQPAARVPASAATPIDMDDTIPF